MARIKAESTWTQVPNTWLREKNLSLKAKGLIAVIQALPDDWNFSVAGLATILKDGLDSTRSAVHELEETGYLTRTQIRSEDGKIIDTIWTLYEYPHKLDEPPTENAPMVTPTQYNTNKKNTNKKRESDSAFASSDPFSFDVSKKDKQEGGDSLASNKKLYAFCADLLALMGLSHVKAGVKLKSAVQARLKEGYSELDLRAVARWSAGQSDEFYKVPHSLFSEAGIAGATAKMKERKKANTMRTIS